VPTQLHTAVIGAGPAGLLFSLLSRLRFERTGGDPARWNLRLFDKRTTYSRAHRLRIDKAVFEKIRHELRHPLFDELCAFLDEDAYTPVVNALEEKLLALNERAGVRRESFTLGSGPGEGSLQDLRRQLGVAEGERWTVVGADSVHSTVRNLVAPSLAPLHATHEQLVRLMITGPGLPAQLGRLHQYRLSKVLRSVLDYRLNRNGFGEVDLFLTPDEHQVIAELGANPKHPVPLRPEQLRALRAPLFGRVVELFCRGFGEGPCEVSLVSSFRLEHSVSPRRTFSLPDENATVFIVGDAAVALPFQRGISCMGAGASELARLHCELLEGAEVSAVTASYETAVDQIVARELKVVRGRASLVRGLREFIRISALLPFPIQSWFLSVPQQDEGRLRVTPGAFLNLAVALLSTLGLFAERYELALLLQALGGLVYRATLTFEPPPHGLVKTIWRLQIALWLVVGVIWAARSSLLAGVPTQLLPALAWWVGGLAFAGGLFLFERLGERWWHAGRFDAD
jgi:2-polyprenyl-6-methoxyphenol hydroxylase-like FAD-dependent oxidoreductase